MEEINRTKETGININQLDGEPVDLSSAEIKQIEEEFPKEVINEPEDLSFDSWTDIFIFEGFTEGALKNILTTTRKSFRLYKVTKNSIEFLSRFEIPEGLERDSNLEYCIDQKTCSIRIIPAKSKKIFVLNLDIKTGKLLKEEVVEHSGAKTPDDLVIHHKIEQPKNSQIDSFCSPYFYSEDNMDADFEMAKLRRGKILRRINLEHLIKSMIEKEKLKFENNLAQFSDTLRSTLRFQTYVNSRKVTKYEAGDQNLALIVINTNLAFYFVLIDLRKRKVLESSSVNFLELLGGEEGIQALLQDELQRDPEDQNQQNTEELSWWDFELGEYVYLPNTKSLVFNAFIVNIRAVIKINNLFDHRLLKSGVKIVKQRKFIQGDQMLRRFGEDKILTFYSGQVRSTFIRPLAFLDQETLEETKIEGFEDQETTRILFSLKYAKKQHTPRWLDENRMLIINPVSMIIYDYNLGKVISEKRYCFRSHDEGQFENIENLYVLGQKNSFNIMRTKKNHETGQEEMDTLKTIHLNDYILDLCVSLSSFGFSFFKMRSGNYLYLTAEFLESETRKGLRSCTKRLQVSLELEAKTFKVVKVKKRIMDELAVKMQIAKKFLVGDLFLFQTRLKKYRDETPINHQSLVLLNNSFEILDDSCQVFVRRWPPFISLSSNRVASIGQSNLLYLHEVDSVAKKLILLKKVIITDVKISTFKQFNDSSIVCDVEGDGDKFKEKGEGERTLLLLDKNLDLKSHLKLKGPRSQKPVYIVGEKKLVFVEWRSSEFYSVDLKKGSLFPADSAGGVGDVSQDSGEDERTLYNLKLDDNKITKVFFN